MMIGDLCTVSSTTLHRSIAACHRVEDMDDKILKPIAQGVGAFTGAFFQLAVHHDRPVAVEDGRLCDGYTGVPKHYSTSLLLEDPLYSAPPSTPASLNGIALPSFRGDRGRRVSTYRDQLQRGYGLGDVLGIYFPIASVGGTKYLQVSFQRAAGAPDFSDTEVGLVDPDAGRN
ncbi:hypothetical protein [Bradyrhizobium sp. CCBAU 11357]|uniref:hypothetical protein n=1 Tax=Bradyrhizobium sp. CCBAU 11357 TaxID=1630808 RepID=UPI0023047F5E|nr:hypothetical protein [Bradyrhizobium sp. CCBAU 11357]